MERYKALLVLRLSTYPAGYSCREEEHKGNVRNQDCEQEGHPERGHCRDELAGKRCSCSWRPVSLHHLSPCSISNHREALLCDGVCQRRRLVPSHCKGAGVQIFSAPRLVISPSLQQNSTLQRLCLLSSFCMGRYKVFLQVIDISHSPTRALCTEI